MAFPLCKYPEIQNFVKKERAITYKDGYESTFDGISRLTKDKCFFSNYPKNLNTLAFGEFLPKNGDFHLAD